MDYLTGTGDLASLGATLSSGVLPLVLAALGDTVSIVDSDGEVVFSTSPEMAGARGIAADPVPWDEAFVQGLRSVLANRQDRFEHVQGGTPRDRDRWLGHHAVPLRATGAGDIIGALVVSRDLSAVKRAEKRAADTLRHVATLVHDLRTELNSVIGFSDMMLHESWGPIGDDRYRVYAQHIHLSGTHLLHQINQLLDLSRIDSHGHDLQEEVIDLAALLRQCCQSIEAQAQRNGLALVVSPDSGTTMIRADPGLTRRVALNLLTNAIKFTPTGGQVLASTGLDVEGRPFLAIRDTGIGIAAEHLDKVMEPFAQLDSYLARRHAGSGSGLGLPLSKRFMELHGGWLHLRSEPNQGTTATAWFPPHRVIADTNQRSG
ncbi:MAG: putative sensor histidine [Rhodospirillaceae bacterium]|nr:MAG: putative sensor histidine [Rhodospirillaceae bacterium]TNC98048.1 MAG: putative sensor histidine kinase [Stygiobacter sp.]